MPVADRKLRPGGRLLIVSSVSKQNNCAMFGQFRRSQMPRSKIRGYGRVMLAAVFCCIISHRLQAHRVARYEPTLDSLNQHPLPGWDADPKFGIFIHWGL